MQGKFVTRLVFGLGGSACGMEYVFRQSFQFGFILDKQLEIIGGVKDVFGKTGRE